MGGGTHLVAMIEFSEFIFDMDLVDLPFVGGRTRGLLSCLISFGQIFGVAFLGGSLLYFALEEIISWGMFGPFPYRSGLWGHS